MSNWLSSFLNMREEKGILVSCKASPCEAFIMSSYYFASVEVTLQSSSSGTVTDLSTAYIFVFHEPCKEFLFFRFLFLVLSSLVAFGEWPQKLKGGIN